MRDLIDRIDVLPIEYRADLTFALLQSELKLTSGQREKLVGGMFEDAIHAKYATPLIEATTHESTVAKQEALNLRWLPLDVLDVQLRAASAEMLRPRRAWQLFERIDVPAARTSCAQALVPDVRPYYELLARLMKSPQGAPFEGEIGREDYLIELVRAIRTPSQLEGFVNVFVAADIDTSQTSLVMDALSRQISDMKASDREMMAAESYEGSLSAAIGRLITKAKDLHCDTSRLLQSYRQFLVSSLHSDACTDGSLNRSEAANRFNALSTEMIGPSPKPVRQLSTIDLKPAGDGGAAAFETIDEDSKVQGQLHQLFKVFAANQTAMYQLASIDRYHQPEQADVDAILAHLRGFTVSGNSSQLRSYENKQSVLMSLIDFLPPGPSFHDAVDAEAAFLNLNPVEEASQPAWLRAMKELVMISRPVSPAAAEKLRDRLQHEKKSIMLPSADSDFIRQTLHRYTSDRIISTYLAFEDAIVPAYTPFEESSRN